MSGLWAMVKKDFQVAVAGKLFLFSLIMLVVFSLYINFVYARLDTEPLLLPAGVNAGDSVAEGGIVTGTMLVGQFNLEEKNRREISNEVLFFEVTAVGFLGLAALLFKEKSAGLVRLHGVLPRPQAYFVVSKLVLFLGCDLLYAAVLIVVCLGPGSLLPVLLRALPHLAILSVVMGLSGFLGAMLYNDFKQFTVVFSLLILLVSLPVYLGGNRTMDWAWLEYNPVYHLFLGLKGAFFGHWSGSVRYFSIAVLVIAGLFWLALWAVKRESARG